MKKWYKIIDELTVLTGKLIRLALEVGTLISVIHMILQNSQEWGENLKPDWIISFLHCKGNKMKKVAKLILNVLRLAVIVAGLYLIFFR